MDWSAFVTVGRVVRPHGIRGHVVVAPETDFGPERFAVGQVMMADAGARTLIVIASREHHGRWIVGFEGISTIEEAERLRDADLRVPPGELHALGAGRYYVHDLAGCEVMTAGGETLGRVDRVELGTGTPLLVVAGTRGEILVPLAETICRRVDVAAKQIVIEPPDGLIDLNVTRARTDRPTR